MYACETYISAYVNFYETIMVVIVVPYSLIMYCVRCASYYMYVVVCMVMKVCLFFRYCIGVPSLLLWYPSTYMCTLLKCIDVYIIINSF